MYFYFMFFIIFLQVFFIFLKNNFFGVDFLINICDPPINHKYFCASFFTKCGAQT